jgi:TonB family protein
LKKEKKEDSFIKNPFYKGGNQAMIDFIYRNLRYTKEAAALKLEGVVILKYDINHNGDVIDARVMKSLGSGCDEEAIRVIKLLKFEVPKNPRKLKITFHKDIHIHFKLPKPVANTLPANPNTQQELSIVYNIVTSPKEPEKVPEKKTAPAPSYYYSITTY